MAADDIYRAQFYFEGPTSGSGFSVYYQEDSAATAPTRATESLANSLATALQGPTSAILTSEWRFTKIEVHKVNGDPMPKGFANVLVQQGVYVGNSLPATNSWIIRLIQQKFPQTSNGRVYVPGVPEGASSVGRLAQAFIDTEANDYRNALAGPISEVAGSGTWNAGVISTKVLNAAPPFKDWDGAFAPVATAQIWPVIARQNRRITRARGFAT